MAKRTTSTRSGVWLSIALAGLAVSCRKAPAGSPPNTLPTPATHTWFYIQSGAHAVDCAVCHSDPNAGAMAYNCLSCHTNNTTSQSIVAHTQAVTDGIHTGVHSLPDQPQYSFAGTGTACYSCHATAKGIREPFDHAGLANGSAASCNLCHAQASEFFEFAGAAGSEAFSQPDGGVYTLAQHVPMNGQDCGACHVMIPGDAPNSTWASATGAPTDPKADPTQDIVVNALIPTYSGTSISQLSPQMETLLMNMLHASAEIPSGASSACTNCHTTISTATTGQSAYAGGRFHGSLTNLMLSQPTGCVDCHASAMPTGFVGPVISNGTRNPPSGEMKHDAVVWSGGVPTAMAIVPTTCEKCHQSPGGRSVATWQNNGNRDAGSQPVLFHASMIAASQPVASCVDCHANSRPVAIVTTATGVQFDHSLAVALADCQTCHVASSPAFATWKGGAFHANVSAPSTCSGCHEGERPTSSVNPPSAWTSATYQTSPFDYVPNAQGALHGDGADCSTCHTATNAWVGGHFAHGAGTLSAQSCIACHSTQRPDLLPGATEASMNTLLGFDHVVNGTGDCIGCHQATVTAGHYVVLANPFTTKGSSDWSPGQQYPGPNLIGTPSQNVKVTEITLNKTGALVTSMTSNNVTLYNEMLHTSVQVPAAISPGNSLTGDPTKCHWCHTSDSMGNVTSFANGQFHPAVVDAGLAQPTTGCGDCHNQMRPTGIVERDGGALWPMDHTEATAQVDCSSCHFMPGLTWSDGTLHKNIGAQVPADCTVCHYPGMVVSAADIPNGTKWTMKHRSTQLSFQNCQTCHKQSLANGVTTPDVWTLWETTDLTGGPPGNMLHAAMSSKEPTACVDCHAVSEPAANTSTPSSVVYALASGGTATNGAQWLNHGSSYVAGLDCAKCHSADDVAVTQTSTWLASDLFHPVVTSVTTCNACHGTANGGGTTVGTNNNMPSGLTNSTMVTSAAMDSTTGVPAGTLDQINHADINVAKAECNLCHTQVGKSTVSGIQGKEWAQASFHKNFTGNALTMNATTGRCSNCHLNVKPTSMFTTFAHSAFTDVSGSEDCSTCHAWPGTGTATSPNWLGAQGTPQYINVGGFIEPDGTTTEPNIANLPHPTVPSGTACTTCHSSNTVFQPPAIAYDHASTLINANCSACHEWGSNHVSVPYNGQSAELSGAGDTRPIQVSSLQIWKGTNGGNGCTMTVTNHFYPANCYDCHTVSTTAITGNTPGPSAAYLASGGAGVWTFPHQESNMRSDCNTCHGPCPGD